MKNEQSDNLKWHDSRGLNNEKIKEGLLEELRNRGLINNGSVFENNAVEIALKPKKSNEQTLKKDEKLAFQPSSPSPEPKQEKQKTLDEEMADNLEKALDFAAELFSAPKPKPGSTKELQEKIQQAKKLILTVQFQEQPQPQYRLNITPTPIPKPGGVL